MIITKISFTGVIFVSIVFGLLALLFVTLDKQIAASMYANISLFLFVFSFFFPILDDE